jgi:ribonuclease P protein component
MRLCGARQFERVFKNGLRTRSEAFSVLARRNDLGVARLGLAIARKALSRAADRNRVKRRVRESFRAHQNELRGLDIVVVGRPHLRQLTPSELAGILETHWVNILHRLPPADDEAGAEPGRDTERARCL